MNKTRPKLGSAKLPVDLLRWLKVEAAKRGVPMYALVEWKFARERERDKRR